MDERKDVKKQWHAMLSHMMEEFRRDNPDDTRGDREIIESIMEYFVAEGLIRKENGKYMLPELIPDA